jgi:hypothetical protein
MSCFYTHLEPSWNKYSRSEVCRGCRVRRVVLMSVNMRNYSAATTPPSPAKSRILIMLKLDRILTYSAPNLIIQEDTILFSTKALYTILLHPYIPRNKRIKPFRSSILQLDTPPPRHHQTRSRNTSQNRVDLRICRVPSYRRDAVCTACARQPWCWEKHILQREYVLLACSPDVIQITYCEQCSSSCQL